MICCGEPKCMDSQTTSNVSYLVPVLMLASAVFLMLTLVAFCVVPEMQNLHGKSIACQSASLMVAFVAMSVTQLTGADSSIVTCKTFGKTFTIIITFHFKTIKRYIYILQIIIFVFSIVLFSSIYCVYFLRELVFLAKHYVL
jgi:O-antigen ligase